MFYPICGGKRYEDLRKRHVELLERATKFVDRDKRVIADFETGKEFMKKNVAEAVRRIRPIT